MLKIHKNIYDAIHYNAVDIGGFILVSYTQMFFSLNFFFLKCNSGRRKI